MSGNKLVTAAGTPYRLLGVNRSSTEYACVQGNGMWDGPTDQATITAMKTWGVNVVRMPLNEECWNAESRRPARRHPGATYSSAIKAYANLLVANGMVAILDLHWTDGLYTGELGRLRVRPGDLPEADTRRRGDPRSGPRWRTRSRATTR